MTVHHKTEGLLPAELAAAAPALDPMGNLERIFLENQGRVFRAAFRVTGNASDAEDVLQTVFLRLARREAGAVDVTHVSSYLYRAAVNTALDVLRGRRESVPIEEVEPAAPSGTSDEAVSREDLRRGLRRALAGLPPRWAEIFVLRHFEGYGNHEIAKMLGMSRATVGVTLFRARHRLQKALREQAGEGR
jgi:RNA polymerase sigma-70 factor, ECF subfamily